MAARAASSGDCSAGQPGRDRGRERAAGSVGVGRVDPRRREHVERRAVEDDVLRAFTAEVAALDDDEARPERLDPAGRLARRPLVDDIDAREHGCLRGVGRDDGGERQEQLAERGDGILAEEAIAALRDHHGIDDEAGHAVGAQPVGHRPR